MTKLPSSNTEQTTRLLNSNYQKTIKQTNQKTDLNSCCSSESLSSLSSKNSSSSSKKSISRTSSATSSTSSNRSKSSRSSIVFYSPLPCLKMRKGNLPYSKKCTALILSILALGIMYPMLFNISPVFWPDFKENKNNNDLANNVENFQKSSVDLSERYFIEKRKSEDDENSDSYEIEHEKDQKHENELEDFIGSARTENIDHVKGTFNEYQIKQDLKTIYKSNNIRYPTESEKKTFVFENDFDFEGEDIMVYLHIQKTGGTTFGRQLVENLNLCEQRLDKNGVQLKRRNCGRDINDRTSEDTWIFSRFSTGWACGLHADFTELKECLPEYWKGRYRSMNLTSWNDRIRQRKVKWITTLREPVRRYISEWQHVSRGATWKNSKLRCNGKNHGWVGRKDFEERTQAKVSLDELENEPNNNITPDGLMQVKPCWEKDDITQNSWKGVTLDEFLNCEYNLAANRQVRMLADLSDAGIDCYSNIFPADNNPNYNSTMDKILESAKTNLRDRISFFTLTEFQRLSQYLFERTFKKNFDVKFVQKSSTVAGSFINGDNEIQRISDEDVKRIKEVNRYRKF